MRITLAHRLAGARLLTGAVVAAGAVAGVVAAAALPWPDVRTAPPALEVTPAPAELVLACDGPALALGRGADAQSLSVAGTSKLTAGNALGEDPAADALAQPSVQGEAAAERLVQQPDGRAPVSAAASSSAALASEDIAGFSASACRPGQMESWIVGGETETGATGILLVANPGDVSATVQITSYGVMGAVTAPGADAIPVPARTQIALPLASLVGGEQSPVLRITATGAPVRASLQSSLVRTLEPSGTDTQAAVRPAAEQIVPGVRVVKSAAGAEQAATVARLLSQQEGTATIEVTARGEDTDPVRTENVPLEADMPVEVDLGGLDEGEYVVAVRADVPLVAAVWQRSGFGAGSDYAWLTPAPPLTTTTLVAVPAGPSPRISIADASGEGTTATITAADGDEREVVVPAGGAASVAVEADALYEIDPGGAAVHATIGFAAGDALAAIAVWPDAAHPETVTVYP